MKKFVLALALAGLSFACASEQKASMADATEPAAPAKTECTGEMKAACESGAKPAACTGEAKPACQAQTEAKPIN